jgi:Holliday junction resolvase
MTRAENSIVKFCPYRFGREAEFLVAVFLKARGWNLNLSKGSRGPADIIATRDRAKLLIQVKSSNLVPRLKGYEIKRLIVLAELVRGSAVIATLQPSFTALSDPKEGQYHDSTDGIYHIGDYSLNFYVLPNFNRLALQV